MTFLSLFAAYLSIELNSQFRIEFNPNCSQFFTLKGEEDFAYLYREENQFVLWHTRNDSYSIFTHPWSETLIFEWPSSINGRDMHVALSHEKIDPPLKFDEEQILCEIYGLAVGSLVYYPSPPKVELFKCEHRFKNSIQYMVVLVISVLTALAFVAAGLGNYEPIKVILQSIISGIFQRRREFLSRGEEDLPPSYQETYI